jgi:hypothetical protein
MTTRPLDTTRPATIEGYLNAVATHLTGPARARRAILAELHDGLLEATSAQQAHGATPHQAATAAIEEFGDPAMIARGFASELAAASARRVAVTLTSTGPFVGLLWLAAYATSRLGPVELAPPWRWPAAPAGSWFAFPIVGAAVLVSALATLLVLASTGRRFCLLPTQPGTVALAAAIVGVAAIVVDLTMLGLLATKVTTQPDSLAWAPLALAITTTLTRLLLASRATRHCQALHATLT